MATYVGFTAAGIPGAIIATLGEVTPSIIVILIVAAVLHSFRNNKYVDQAFYGLRPASTGLIGAACAAVVLEVLTTVQLAAQSGGIVKTPVLGGGSLLRGLGGCGSLLGLLGGSLGCGLLLLKCLGTILLDLGLGSQTGLLGRLGVARELVRLGLDATGLLVHPLVELGLGVRLRERALGYAAQQVLLVQYALVRQDRTAGVRGLRAFL